jgi:hypothetical protein
LKKWQHTQATKKSLQNLSLLLQWTPLILLHHSTLHMELSGFLARQEHVLLDAAAFGQFLLE